MADLIIAKHRNGGLDRIKLRFKGELTKFVNPEPQDDIVEPDYNSLPPPPEDIPPESGETFIAEDISDDELPPF